MRTIQVGIVGCGEVAQRIYLPEFHRLHDKAVLVAVCDQVEERARAAQQRFGARTYYTDLDRFLRESNAEIVVTRPALDRFFDSPATAGPKDGDGRIGIGRVTR